MDSTDDTNHRSTDTRGVHQTKRALQTSKPSQVKMIKEQRSQEGESPLTTSLYHKEVTNEIL